MFHGKFDKLWSVFFFLEIFFGEERWSNLCPAYQLKKKMAIKISHKVEEGSWVRRKMAETPRSRDE